MKEQKERLRILRKAGMSEADAGKISEAIGQAERSTSGEIVAVLTPESHSYAFWELLFALSCAAVFFVVFVFFSDTVANALAGFFGGRLPFRFMSVLTGAVIFICTALLFFFANVPVVDRLIVPVSYRNNAVFGRAMRFFAESGIYDTKEHTGILIFISLMEKRVCIIADRGICTKIEQTVWNNLAATVSAGFAKKQGKLQKAVLSDPAAALIKTIEDCAALLKKHFPANKDNSNRLCNSLIVLEGGE